MNTIVNVKRKENPVRNANIFSQMFFIYTFPIFKRTFSKEMDENDVFEPLPEHKSSIIGDQLEKVWKEEYRIHKKTALHRALIKVFGLRFLVYGIIKGIEEFMFVILLPISIGKVVSYFQKEMISISKNDVYLYAGLMSFCFFMDCGVTHPIFMGFEHSCMKLKIACTTLVYRKALRLSRTSLSKATVGQIINLLSNDVNKFSEGFIAAHYVWIAPIQTGIGVYLIYREIFVSAFVGIAFLLAFIPVQIWVAKLTATLRLRTALRTDERVCLMNEIITGIQVIKMYCWEKPFAKLIERVRRKEMQSIRAHQYLTALIFALEIFITRTSIFTSILMFVLLGNYLSADKVFAVTGIYNVIRPIITTIFSISILSVAEVSVTLKRIQEFLCYDEFLKDQNLADFNTLEMGTTQETLKSSDLKIRSANGNVINKEEHKQQNGFYNKQDIILNNIDAVWLSNSEGKDLENLNLNITGNQLVAIIGPVGSGKSSLLHLFLKELTIIRGTMHIHGSIAYAAQEPWLFSGSIRQNILFGEKYDKDRYDDVLRVCALMDDLKLFPNGDKTLVGERGKILSGGQKARINLARCVYKEADIYLLDDPLSAVDVNVGNHLYNQCIAEFLRGKICILVTHQLQYLHTTDKILIMEDGKIRQTGTFDELQSSGLDFARLLVKSESEETDKDKKKIQLRQLSVTTSLDGREDESELTDAEEIFHGTIKMSTYYEYIRHGGNPMLIFLLVSLFVIGNVMAYGGDYFVTYWVNLEQDFAKSNHTNNTEPPFSRQNIIYAYSGLTLGTIVFSLAQTIYFMAFFTKASSDLHNATFDKLIKATMSFFNSNSSGRILNRFSQDIGNVDYYLPPVMLNVITVGLTVVSATVLACIIEPLIFPGAVIMCAICLGFRSIYLRTSRNIKRIMAVTKSPVFSHITATLHGLTTIRAYNAEDILINEFDYFQDRNSSANHLFLATSECFALWIRIVCVTFTSIATFSLIVFDDSLYGGDIGLVVTEYIGVLISIDWGMRQWCELENQMTSTERIIEYKKVAIEPERTTATNLPKTWPADGRLEFRNINLKYNDTDPYVLKDINFIVQPKEKVGIVGRTGAGKSSIIASLFQLYPLEGTILIDDIDTTKLLLDDVRSKISIIPQEPVLFSGTMRKNLDPFEEYSDKVLWEALEEVQLKETVTEMSQGLNSQVFDGGSNFSVGERQLVCLARALIRHNKILVLDEATASADPFTDSLIQKTIKSKFADSTVLTIAHRLNTVMDSDKILVMDGGKILEFDHPYLLLQNERSLLHALVEATGDMTLRDVAEKSFQGRKKYGNEN